MLFSLPVIPCMRRGGPYHDRFGRRSTQRNSHPAFPAETGAQASHSCPPRPQKTRRAHAPEFRPGGNGAVFWRGPRLSRTAVWPLGGRIWAGAKPRYALCPRSYCETCEPRHRQSCQGLSRGDWKRGSCRVAACLRRQAEICGCGCRCRKPASRTCSLLRAARPDSAFDGCRHRRASGFKSWRQRRIDP